MSLNASLIYIVKYSYHSLNFPISIHIYIKKKKSTDLFPMNVLEMFV